MKRFIDLQNQTGNINYEVGEREFSFYCTISDKFESFSDNYTWNSVQDFREDFDGDNIQRYLNLIPEYINLKITD